MLVKHLQAGNNSKITAVGRDGLPFLFLQIIVTILLSLHNNLERREQIFQ